MKNILGTAALAGMLAMGTAFAAEKPTSVIHVVTIKWKDGTTEDQKKAVFTKLDEVSRKFPGIKRIWTRAIKVQGNDFGGTSALVMEFESEAALKQYGGSEAQKAWYEVYLPVRDQSRTHDITN